MPTSELSDALNPNLYHRRSSHHATNAPTVPEANSLPAVNPFVHRPSPVAEASPIHFVPHRSELEDAMNPRIAQQASPSCPLPQKQTRQPPTEPIQILKDILATFHANREATDAERQRRLAWEKEQEAKDAHRQAEVDNRMRAMQQEIDGLRAFITTHSFPNAASKPVGQAVTDDHVPNEAMGVSSGDNAVANSTRPLPNNSTCHSPIVDGLYTAFSALDRETSTSYPEFMEGSSAASLAHDAPREEGQTRRKRPRLSTPPEAQLDALILITDSYDSQMKLRTRHDSRPQTIQAAMRYHVLRLMNLEHDKELPDPHNESEILGDDAPVRFVWDKTTKRSVHNNRMKTRVVSDMIANKGLYPLVPKQEFTKPLLEPVFEQAFTTLRQKFRSQRDGAVASRAKEREDIKSRRARRQSRKKLKLTRRAATRKEFNDYALDKFDGAFQLECMSSEESSEEEIFDDASSDEEEPRTTFLRIRYLAWRSARLHRLFQVLDEREEIDHSQKPRRGIGRKDRRMGLPKDGTPLPPMGIARWMISKRWLREVAKTPRIAEIVDEAVAKSDDVDWSVLSSLGVESDEEQPPLPLPQPLPHQDHYGAPYYTRWTEGDGYLDQMPLL